MKFNHFTKVLIASGLILAGSVSVQAAESGREPIKIIQTEELVFPFSMVRTQLRGEARIAINVDSQGVLKDMLVLAYTKKPFADTAVEGLKTWKFEAARINGQPVGAVSEISIDFTATGVVISQTMNDVMEALYNLTAGARTPYDYKLCTMREIDRIPVPVSVIRPNYPQELAKKDIVGQVTVVFFIDETGAIRMPAVTRSDNDLLADLAIDALKQWKFEPPTRRGVPVLVRAVQVFNFVPGSKVEIKAMP